MSAFTTVSKVYDTPAAAGGDGIKIAFGTAVPTASYDTGGSAIDLSDVFGSTVLGVQFFFQNADFRFQFQPTATTYAAATGTVFVDDNAGTEASSTDNISSSVSSCYWIAWGTDA